MKAQMEKTKQQNQKQKPILSWNELDILEGIAENQNCETEDLKASYIEDEMDFEWECLAESLTEILEKKCEDGYWYVEVNGFGWRNLDGYAKLDIKNGTDLIAKVLPDCEKSFYIYDNGDKGLSINCFHHDSPTGEWYYLTPMTFEEFNNEEAVSE